MTLLARIRGHLFRFRYSRGRVAIGAGLTLGCRLEIKGPGRVSIGNHCTVSPVAGDTRQYVTIYTNSPDAVVSIGDHAVLCAARISSKFEISIGDHALIEESGIMDTDFHTITQDRGEPAETREQCRITIGHRVAIGARSTVCKGVHIGDDVLIFPGSVVNKDVPAGAVVAGNPVRPFKRPPSPAGLGVAALVVAGALSAMACGTAQETNTMSVAATTDQQWTALLGTRVAFGHQSVGGNILNGVRTLAEQASVNLRISESRDLSTDANIVHFRIGENGNPASKMKDFSAVLQSAGNVKIAAMKLCYLDFTPQSDGGRIADDYIATIDRLAAEHPGITFVAFTAPLTVRQTGPKAWIKRMMGQSPAGFGENVRRTQFNERLRARYAKDGRLFDLARIEAQDTERYSLAGQPFEALSPSITSDGGHLNPAGERLVASKLVAFLATLPAR